MYRLSIMYLINKIKAINKVYDQLDSHILNFKENSSISCKSNCGICCQKSNIEATVLEFLPAAMSLYQSGKYEQVMNHAEIDPCGLCVFYNPFIQEGFCSHYQNRGLICRLFGFAVSRAHARTIVRHGHVRVGDRRVNIPSYILGEGETLSISPKYAKNAMFQLSLEAAKGRGVPRWLETVEDQTSGKVVSLPTREDVGLPVQEQLIVELYSK